MALRQLYGWLKIKANNCIDKEAAETHFDEEGIFKYPGLNPTRSALADSLKMIEGKGIPRFHPEDAPLGTRRAQCCEETRK
ncbi:hypothetical protein PAAG_08036 [Paracoccidioides lutzii Pb01]|uniref:Uncharacterized protein n=1 Tax=Paracoccidioides lutzii (strain ATCC MYA-826 / Pb01) TaxID=502779 RepID=C1HB95_PARBA|nr:hypothetical protein PAAG_08036 [Paracoccidioides lutzii Pb01]EEH37618.2 hypothetical protein PAAG_08036 [Paracoccidioides lutzii Pb01]